MYDELKELQEAFKEICARNNITGWGATGELANLLDRAFFTGYHVAKKEERRRDQNGNN